MQPDAPAPVGLAGAVVSVDPGASGAVDGAADASGRVGATAVVDCAAMRSTPVRTEETTAAAAIPPIHAHTRRGLR